MNRPEPARVVAALAAAVALLGVLIVAIGWEAVHETVTRTDPTIYALGFASMACCLLLRGRIWFRVLEAVGYEGSFPPILGAYLTARFAKYVAPYGQFAAPPGIAYAIANRTGIEYEDGLAAVLASMFLNYLPYYTFGGFGLLSLLVGWTVTATLWTYAIAFLGVTGSVLIGVSLVWCRRDATKKTVALAFAPIRSVLETCYPSGARSLEAERIRERSDEFYRALDLVSADRSSMVTALAYGHVAWFFFAFPLYVTALSIGAEVSLTAAVIAVALSKAGFLVPTPGGLGGVEAVVAVVLSLLTPISGAAAVTVAILYRVVAYWFPVVIGGVAAVVLSLEW